MFAVRLSREALSDEGSNLGLVHIETKSVKNVTITLSSNVH